MKHHLWLNEEIRFHCITCKYVYRRFNHKHVRRTLKKIQSCILIPMCIKYMYYLISCSAKHSNTCNTAYYLSYVLTRVQRCCRYLIKSRDTFDEVTYFCYNKAINYEKLTRWKKCARAKLLILATIATINSVWRSHIQNVVTM